MNTKSEVYEANNGRNRLMTIHLVRKEGPRAGSTLCGRKSPHWVGVGEQARDYACLVCYDKMFHDNYKVVGKK